MKHIKKYLLILLLIGSTILSVGQSTNNGLKMTTNYDLTNSDLWNILNFEGIQFSKAIFTGDELRNKSFHLRSKEVWDGEVVSDSTIMDSKTFPFEELRNINDTIFEVSVISELSTENMLKMQFNFPKFLISREFKAHETKFIYRLRNIVSESNMEINYNKPFVLFACILPYEREDNTASYCDVGTSGHDIENWGKKFGIKHYILFEMEFN